MTLRKLLAVVLVFQLLPWVAGPDRAARAQEPSPSIAIGAKAPGSNSLRDLRGNRRALLDFKGHKAIVLAFLGSECPISNLYLPELIALEKTHRAKGVQFLGVYPNHADDLDRIASHAYDRDASFLLLKDNGQKLATALGVTRVPTVVVLDGDHVLRYRGRIDDRYGASARRPQATRDDLAVALEEVLAGKKVSAPETEAAVASSASTPKAVEPPRSPTTSMLPPFCRLAVKYAIGRTSRRRSRS
jgi:peroxiredoxin